MDDQAELNDLILAIYDTALDAGRWPAVLERVACSIGARGAFIFELDGAGAERRIRAPYFSEGYDPTLVQQYLDVHNAQELQDQDEFARCSKLTDTIELIGDVVLARSEAELLARANMQEMIRYGIRYRAGALLNKDQINHDRFAVQFSAKAGAISAGHHERAALLMPHIAKALNVSRPLAQLARRHEALLQSVDMLLIGVCILNAKGIVVLANKEFRRQLESYRIFRQDPSGKLMVRSDGAGRAFSQLTAAAALAHHGRFGARPRKEAVVTDIDGTAHTLCIEVAPLNRADGLAEPSLEGHVVYSMDTGNLYAIDADVLTRLFALTAAEAVVLELMAEGLTNVQISERRSKSVETVNTQVKSILEKTGSHNRTQAIRLATNISASFVTAPPPPTPLARPAISAR